MKVTIEVTCCEDCPHWKTDYMGQEDICILGGTIDFVRVPDDCPIREGVV